MKYKKGVIIGFIIGVLSVPLSLLGLGSKIGMIFYPLIIIPKLLTFGLTNSVITLWIFSVIVYVVIGFLIQFTYYKLKEFSGK